VKISVALVPELARVKFLYNRHSLVST